MNIVATLRHEPAVRAQPSPASALDLILDLARARARRLAALMERRWSEGRTSPDQGLAIGPGEVARLVESDSVRDEELASAEADPALADCRTAITSAEDALERHPLWKRLSDVFSLDEEEKDLLVLLAAVDADPGLQRVVAYLHDDIRRDLPTPVLAAELAGRPRRPWQGANLRRWALAQPVDEGSGPALAAAWTIDPALTRLLAGGTFDDPVLGDAVQLIDPSASAALLLFHGEAFDALGRAADLADVELTGPPGIGRQSVAQRHAAATGKPLLVADLAILGTRGVAPREAILRVLRHARLTGALAYFREAGDVPSGEWTLARALGVDFLRGLRLPTNAGITIRLAPLTLSERETLWRSLSDRPCPDPLFARRLTPGEIARLVGAGHGLPRPRQPDHHLLARLDCPYEWDDMVLGAETARHLREFADQVRLRWRVYDDWGFRKLTHLGCGIAALFAGPSGTGKTMAAQVIARALGLDLFRVDLAGVVNKYVGETEKKLRELFDACEDSGALLFFDEADALFGSRMQVKDAHDRFANIEIDYLLQRIETFDGVAILATNRREDVDDAFARRLRFIVNFLPPQRAERLALWRLALRECTPSGDPLLDAIDWDLLADRLTLTGAAIKNVALSAAFLACSEKSRVTMAHILHGAERELAKNHDKLPLSLRRGGER
jgi:MoxR-like ATPase